MQVKSRKKIVVYRSIPTSNRNRIAVCKRGGMVVYRSIPTSNRNYSQAVPDYAVLYIVLFLHQTATTISSAFPSACCISFYSYIKPQRKAGVLDNTAGCISFYSYIKPQLTAARYDFRQSCISFYSYIKPQRCVGSRIRRRGCISFYSYIKPQLRLELIPNFDCCISFYSYIKPQHVCNCLTLCAVVYRSIPTSNRNYLSFIYCKGTLYIVLFLHQTATRGTRRFRGGRCISFYSYIKPQHDTSKWFAAEVVYRSIPTSNRNFTSDE